MTIGLLIVVTLLYAGAAVGCIRRADFANATILAGYTIANLGLIAVMSR